MFTPHITRRKQYRTADVLTGVLVAMTVITPPEPDQRRAAETPPGISERENVSDQGVCESLQADQRTSLWLGQFSRTDFENGTTTALFARGWTR